MISQDIFAKAAKEKNATKLLMHLAAFPINQELVDELATLVRHCSALIHSRPNLVGQTARDKLLADVRGFLESAAPLLSFEPLFCFEYRPSRDLLLFCLSHCGFASGLKHAR
jgi:hypothetical protein